MSSEVEIRRPRAVRVVVNDETLNVELEDGRAISTPIAWYPRLSHATEAERENYTFIAGGEGIHWPQLDEDLSVESMLLGRPSGEGPESLARWLDSRQS